MASIIIPDVSEFQGVIDWDRLGTEVAIVRINYGDLHVDAKVDVNIEGARRRCVARGWYCYLVAGRDPVAQANTFCKVLIAHGGLKPNEFIVCDDEESTGADEVQRINAFLARCDASLNSKSDWWYSGLNFEIAHNLTSANGHRWVAAYVTNEPLAAHELWQFTSSGRVAGISGNVDLSIFHGTTDDFIRLIGGVTQVNAANLSGGNMVVLPAPFSAGRLDVLVIGMDGALYHTFSEGGVGGLDNITSWNSYGNLPGGKPIQVGTLGACWDNLNRLCIVCSGSDHIPYIMAVRASDGGFDQGWTEMNGRVGIPADQAPIGVPGPPGPPGPIYDDTDMSSRVLALEGFQAKIKAAIS